MIKINPDCLAVLSSEEAFKLLDCVLMIFKHGQSALKILEVIDFNESPEQIVDYSLLFDLEDLLIEKEEYPNNFGSKDSAGVVKYARNSLVYFNEACDVLDVDSCSNTILDCAEMNAKLKFAVANSGAFIYYCLLDLITYVQYLNNLKNPALAEQTKEQYPDFENTDVEYSPAITQILSREGTPESPETLSPFVTMLIEVIKKFPAQGTAILCKYSEYSEFYDILDMYNQLEIQESNTLIMPQDVEHILNVAHTDASLLETNFETLADKIEGRLGAIEGVSSISYPGLDSLIWLGKYCNSSDDFEVLYVNERSITSDLKLCYLSIAREDISSLRQSGNLSTTSLF